MILNAYVILALQLSFIETMVNTRTSKKATLVEA